MGVLRLTPLSAAALAACYEPRLPDCAVACSSSSECAPGQLCSAGYCSAPDQSCSLPGALPDGPPPTPSDAPPRDAGPPQDSVVKVLLRVRADDGGEVVVQDIGTCDGDAAQQGGAECWYAVPVGLPLLLRAVPHNGYEFDRWSTPVCGAQDATCMFTPTAAVTEVRARFEQDDE
jgi:hypothetical protein